MESPATVSRTRIARCKAEMRTLCNDHFSIRLECGLSGARIDRVDLGDRWTGRAVEPLACKLGLELLELWRIGDREFVDQTRLVCMSTLFRSAHRAAKLVK